MLKDDLIKVLNAVFQKAKIPLKITDMFLYRPVYHEPPFENFEPINEAKRLAVCNPIWVEFDLESNDRRYMYQLRCKNNKGAFSLGHLRLKSCDYYEGEDPKKLERDMKSDADLVTRLLLQIFELLAKE